MSGIDKLRLCKNVAPVLEIGQECYLPIFPSKLRDPPSGRYFSSGKDMLIAGPPDVRSCIA